MTQQSKQDKGAIILQILRYPPKCTEVCSRAQDWPSPSSQLAEPVIYFRIRKSGQTKTAVLFTLSVLGNFDLHVLRINVKYKTYFIAIEKEKEASNV